MTPLLLIDVETTGIEPESDSLIEVGAVLFDADLGVVEHCFSAIMRPDPMPTENPAEWVNRIPIQLVEKGWPRRAALQSVRQLRALSTDTVLVAHSATFEEKWLPELEGPWLCTYRDASWPLMGPKETGGLTAIALAYGLWVARAHRAIEDCLTLAALLSRVHELEGGLEDWLERAREPKVELVAQVSYARRQLAKDAGFRWMGDNERPAGKAWVRDVRVSRVEEVRAGLTFGTKVTREAKS